MTHFSLCSFSNSPKHPAEATFPKEPFSLIYLSSLIIHQPLLAFAQKLSSFQAAFYELLGSEGVKMRIYSVTKFCLLANKSEILFTEAVCFPV